MTLKYKNFGIFIRNRRLKLGIKQKELATYLGYTTQFVSNWERGKSRPSISVLSELRKILKLNKHELLERYLQEDYNYLKKIVD